MSTYRYELHGSLETARRFEASTVREQGGGEWCYCPSHLAACSMHRAHLDMLYAVLTELYRELSEVTYVAPKFTC